MKKNILHLLILAQFVCIEVASQVGISTINPSGVFHIEVPTTPTKTDFVIDNAGNVGIGTKTPQAKLHIKDVTASNASVLKIVDGNQGAGKMLVSDNQGYGKWGIAPGSWYATITGSYENDPLYLDWNQATTGFYLCGANPNLSTVSNEVNGGVIQLGSRNTPASGLDSSPAGIIVPFTGRYKITVSGEFSIQGSANIPALYNGTFLINTRVIDGVSFTDIANVRSIGYIDQYSTKPTSLLLFFERSLSAKTLIRLYFRRAGVSPNLQADRLTLTVEFIG